MGLQQHMQHGRLHSILSRALSQAVREKVTSYESAKMHSTRTPRAQGGKIRFYLELSRTFLLGNPQMARLTDSVYFLIDFAQRAGHFGKVQP